jgi:hypothetical protein
MDHSYDSTTVTMDKSGLDSLQDQILNIKHDKNAKNQDIREKSIPEPTSSDLAKKYIFKKGDQSLEMDEDYELEFMADKRPMKLTLRELKERAAGDIAVKNRMHSLAEERKRVQSTFSEFTKLAKTDPLAALEYISNKAKESDSEFEYSKYIEKLADQADKLGKMDDKERKAWELEKKLAKAEENLSHRERTEAVALRKQELLSQYDGIGDSQFGDMVDAVLDNDALMEGLKDEHDVMDRVEQLIQETLTQKDIMTVIKEINPEHLKDTSLIFSLSDQLKQNPDLDEEDVRDILRELIGKQDFRPTSAAPRSERQRDIQTLSSKARQSSTLSSVRAQNASPYDLLTLQLQERKKELSKTPLYKR